MLMNAALDGRLEKALEATAARPEKKEAEIKAKAKDMLTKGALDGSLEKALEAKAARPEKKEAHGPGPAKNVLERRVSELPTEREEILRLFQEEMMKKDDEISKLEQQLATLEAPVN